MASQLNHIEIVVQQLNRFNPENESVGHFLDETAAKAFQAFSVTDETFLMATLSGCIEYKPLLDVVVNAFYTRDGKHCLLSEHNLYVVVCYLATFQLDELGLQQFSRMVKAADPVKICKFLRFFFNVVNLHTWIKDEWNQIYDSAYVNENWIEPLLRWQPKVKQLIDQLDDKSIKYTATASKTTEPKAFNLTVPNPRPIMVPELIPQVEKTKPVPKTTYKPQKLKERLEGIRLKNRRKAEELLLDANVNQFNCAAPHPGCHCGAGLIPTIPERFRAQKIKGEIDNVPVKLNATAILREGVLYQRKVEQELNRIEQLLRGGRDPSEFLEWQNELYERDFNQKLADTECKRLQGQLSHEEAILARQNRILENHRKAELKREEEAEMSQQIAERRIQERKEREKMVQQVVEGRKNVKQARMKLQKYKRQIAQEVAEESQEILLQSLKEEEERFKKRYELIQQIRAIEYLPLLKHKFVDLTQTPNHGVLGEMSIVELQERLALLKQAQKKAEEEKRDQIIQEKYAKEQLLLDKLEQISMFRDQFGRAAALKLEEKKTKPPLRERILKDQQVLELKQKIMEKSMERKMQAEKLQTASLKYDEGSVTSWRPKKKSQREDHWKKLEESQQRQFKVLQHGFMARELTQKRMTNETLRIGTKACILRS
ncbi:cilia- and flagella-associated protein 99 [Lacerta agilis]|uniref:cilia- and flagella-associated protein 99 n=1 Tax=Lacerta agilis TaxID=80427 RepID=UPI00141A4043|nr:cilia- and flagella-associated protein 99 [Lacerta agilis]XP_033004312.1 cilia- and flagella-associated protein 99 [Lacerta agilis]